MNGEVLGRYGTYLNPDKPSDSAGNPNFITGANFNFGYTKISGSYPATQPGTRAVAAGESLQSIAKSVYGDSSLWYLIADANGMSGDRDLRVGQTLTTPNRVTGAKNNASTFKPYNPGEVVGNTTPNLPNPPAQSSGGGGGGCGGLGSIIVLVVVVVATIYTAGAATAAAAQAASTAAAAAGTTVSAATAAAAATTGFSATMALGAGAMSAGLGIGTAALAYGVGNLAGQVAANLLGMQDGINWTSVATSAIGGAVSSGLAGTSADPGPMAGSGFGMTVARAAVGQALTQGVSVAVGLQKEFNWSGVAMAAVSAGVGQALGSGGAADTKLDGMDRLVRDFGKGMISNTVMAVARGGHIDTQQIAADAFGNALGNSIAYESKTVGQQENKPAQAVDIQASSGNGLRLSAKAVQSFGPQYSFEDVQLPTDYSLADAAQGGKLATQVGSSYNVTVKSGDTVESIARREFGDNWRAGVALIAGDNKLSSNSYGSPVIRQGSDLTIRSLNSLGDDSIASLNRIGGSLVAQNSQQTSAVRAAVAEVLSARNENYGNEGRGYVPASTSATASESWVATNRANDQAFYNNLIANADNPATAVLGTLGRAFNNAAYDIAAGAEGLYKLATDGSVREQTWAAISNAAANPASTAAKVYDAGVQYVTTTSSAQMAEDALRFAVGGLATAGVNKGVGVLGEYALEGASSAGRWLAPAAGDLAENYVARTGGLAYAREAGGVGANNASQAAIRTRVEANLVESTLAREASKFDLSTVAQIERQQIASDFYAARGFSGERLESHLSGIDFNKPVNPVLLRQGSSVDQWVNEYGVGNYFAPVGTPYTRLGIFSDGRTLTTFNLQSDVWVLRSTAADYRWPNGVAPGGGTQYFVGKHDNAFFVPRNQ